MAPPLPVSPLAPATMPALPPVAGVELAGLAVGLKKSGAKDLMVARFAPGTAVAGVLTRSKCASSPVEWCREHLPAGRARGLVVNAGNANAFTGQHGRQAAAMTARAGGKALGCPPEEVFLASTGVIGEPLKYEKITDNLDQAVTRLVPDAYADASAAICTTDTFAKWATARATVDGVTVTINGIVKGSGMIAPDMATMLGFLFTDAAVAPDVLGAMTRRAADRTFNAITVDGDTSTSDTVLVFATGAAGNAPITSAKGRGAAAFARALERVMSDLAKLVVRDGEGASKFIEINVSGARSAKAARRIGLSIANSPLVKTAIAGEDANWGRVVMAVGKAGEEADRDRLSVKVGGVTIAARGDRVPDYDEAPVANHLKGQDIVIDVDLALGRGRATVWTCDLTHGYISINADYRS